MQPQRGQVKAQGAANGRPRHLWCHKRRLHLNLTRPMLRSCQCCLHVIEYPLKDMHL